MKDNGLMIRSKVKELKFIEMMRNTKEIGRTIKKMDKVFYE
jgi:hypothetical protein